MAKGLSYEEAMGLKPQTNGGFSYEEAMGIPTVEAPATGFQARMAQDFAKRKGQVATAEALEPTNAYALTKPAEVVAANLGLVGDTLGNVIGSGARYIGDAGKAIFGDVQAPNVPKDSLLTNNMVVRGAKNILESDMRLYDEFAQANPESARLVNAGASIAVNAPLLKPLAAGGKMVGEAAVVNPVKAIAKNTAANISNAAKGAVARDVPALEAASQIMRDEATQAYTKMRDIGAVLNRNRGVNIANRIETKISTSPLNKRLHGDTLSVLKDFKTRAAKGDLGLEELDQYRQLFSDVVGKNTDIAGKFNADGRLATQAIKEIDNAVGGLGKIDLKGGGVEALDALNQGRAAYYKARKFETVTNVLKKADGDANKIKAGLKSLVNNPKKLQGFSPAEVNALMSASRQTATEGVLKALGKFGFDTGSSLNMGNTALPVIGAALGSPLLTAAGTAARLGQKYIARGKAEDALKTIAKGVGNPK